MAKKETAFIDLRSDTVTQPTPDMRRAMADAVVGDDVYGDDPTIHRLEALAASLLHKEAALFVPSGTFGNQLALLAHCQRGDEVILDDDCHIVQHEAGASAVLAGVQLRTVACPEKGQLPLAAIEARIRKSQDFHVPRTGLICLENAHSSGAVLPLAYSEAVTELARRYGLPVHLDGARLFNAAEYLRVAPHLLAAGADSVMVCLSKGLCAPVGSLLLGSADFIARARRLRKMLGGGMRQAGILAAAGIIALKDMRTRLGHDHRHARLLGKWLAQIPGASVQDVHTNMVFCRLPFAPPLTPALFLQRLKAAKILANGPEDGLMRFVTHHDVREADVRRAAEAIAAIVMRDFW